jgi:hypothetical protein
MLMIKLAKKVAKNKKVQKFAKDTVRSAVKQIEESRKAR